MSSTYSICPKCSQVNKVSIAKAKEKNPTCGACGTALNFHEGISELTAESVQKLIQKSPIPIVIDFWAPWCGPCRSFAPAFAFAAQQLEGKLVFVKINTEAHPSAGQMFSVSGIPTLAIFKNGKEVARQAGAMPKEQFIAWLQNTTR